MNLTKRGFTLAEVLVAMAIVGVIAAATVPMLSIQTQKAQIGPTLGRLISQVETGCRNMIELANENTIEQGGDGVLLGDFYAKDLHSSESSGTSLTTRFVALAPGFLGLEPATTSSINAKNFDGSTNTTYQTEINSATKYHFKKLKSDIMMKQQESITDTNPISIIANLYFDINGIDAKPNIFGKDLFIFRLKNNCRVIPLEVSGNACTKGNITDGTTCGERIVKDRFKVTYY